jgi:hypothetical protein
MSQYVEFCLVYGITSQQVDQFDTLKWLMMANTVTLLMQGFEQCCSVLSKIGKAA